VTFKAHASSSTTAEAKASAAGAEEEKADTPTKTELTSRLAPNEAWRTRRLPKAARREQATTTTPSAETSEGGVSVAAAVGVNIATSTAQAYIPDKGKITPAGGSNPVGEQQYGCDGQG
jgi:mucin-19